MFMHTLRNYWRTEIDQKWISRALPPSPTREAPQTGAPWNVFQKLNLTDAISPPLWLSTVPIHHTHTLFSPAKSVDYREEDLLSDGRLTQHPGGVDQSSAEHTQSPGQLPGSHGNQR